MKSMHLKTTKTGSVQRCCGVGASGTLSLAGVMMQSHVSAIANKPSREKMHMQMKLIALKDILMRSTARRCRGVQKGHTAARAIHTQLYNSKPTIISCGKRTRAN